MTLQKALVLGLGCALVDLVGAWLLDSLGFVEGLLAPSGSQLPMLIPAACAFYGARLVTYFALPALVVTRLLSVHAPALFSEAWLRRLATKRPRAAYEPRPTLPSTAGSGARKSARDRSSSC